MSSDQHVIHLGVVIIILLLVVVMLINCCHGIHRMKTHSKLAEIYRDRIEKIAAKGNNVTEPEKEEVVKYYSYLKSDNWTNLSDAIYDPIAKSAIGETAEKLMFHTTMGRTSLAAQVQLNSFIQNAMATLLGFRINSFISYVVSVSDIESEAQVTVLALVTAFTVLVIIATSQMNLYIQTKMSGNSIIAEDVVDEKLKGLSEEKKTETNP